MLCKILTCRRCYGYQSSIHGSGSFFHDFDLDSSIGLDSACRPTPHNDPELDHHPIHDSSSVPAPDPSRYSRPDSPDDQNEEIEYQEPRVYQRAAIDAVDQALRSGSTRVGVSAPTGAGKTVIFANIIRDTLKEHRKGKVLVLIDTEEQANQAKRRILLAHGDSMVYIGEERGKLRPEAWDRVVIASVKTLQRTSRMDAFKRNYKIADFKLVVVDEAHRSAANTYLQILSEFNGEIQIENSTVAHRAPTHGLKIPLLGVSATFARNDKRKLSWVYEKLAYECSLADLWKGNYLVPVKIWSVAQEVPDIHDPTGIVRLRPPANRLNRPQEEGTPETLDELSFKEIDQLAETEKFNQQVLQCYQSQAQGRRSTLIFSKNIKYVNNLVAMMQEAGIKAKAVIHTTSTAARQDNVASFERGDCSVLVTCKALSEGYDGPHIDCIILAKPTNSPIEHTQMVGRGLRLSPETGKTDCLIIDLVGNCNRFPLGVKPSLDAKKQGEKRKKVIQVKEKTKRNEQTVQAKEKSKRSKNPIQAKEKKKRSEKTNKRT